MNISRIACLGLIPVMMVSCVSSKKFKTLQAQYADLNKNYTSLQGDLKTCNDKNADCQGQVSKDQESIDKLNQQIAYLKENNTQALKQLENLSVITSSQAESIKKSLDNIGAKDAYIQSLQQAMNQKDSLNMRLVMNLKGAIGDINDTDIKRTVDHCTRLCAVGGTVVWTRHRKAPDLVPQICEWFEERGFERVWVSDPRYEPCCGAHRFTAAPALLEPGATMFTFRPFRAPGHSTAPV